MAILIRYAGDEYRLDKLAFTGAEYNAVQRHTGLKVLDFLQGITDVRGDSLALTGVVWLLKRRAAQFVAWHEFEAEFDPLAVEAEVVPDEEPADEPDGDDDPEPPAAEVKPVKAVKVKAA